MTSILVALSGLVGPGFALGLISRWREMAIWLVAVTVALCAITITTWMLWAAAVVWLGSMVHAGIAHRRDRKAGTLRWSWLHPLIAFVAMIAIALGTRLFVVEAFKIPSSSMYPTLQIGDHLFINKLSRSPDRGDLIVFRMPCDVRRDYISRVIALGGDTVEVRCDVVHVNGQPATETLVDAKAKYDDRDDNAGEWYSRDVSRYRETRDGKSYEIFHDADRPDRDKRREASSKDFPRDDIDRTCATPELGGRGSPAPDQQPGKIVTTAASGEDACKVQRHYVVPAGHVFTMGDSRGNSNDSRYWGSVPVGHIKGRVIGIWLPFGRVGVVE